MNLANKLTVFRIILVPVMMLVPVLGLNQELFFCALFLID